MTNCKQIPLPKIDNQDVKKITSFFSMGNHLFSERYGHHAWKSFDIITKGNVSPMINHFPSILKWLTICNKHTALKKVDHLYISILMPRNVDQTQTDIYANSIITSISTDNSFIEFENDKQYRYKEGYSYLIKSGVKHRIMNLNDKHRITLCSTPKENPYAEMA